MNPQANTPYLLSLQAYGLPGFPSPLVGLQANHQVGGQQLGKLAGLSLPGHHQPGHQGYQHNLPLQAIPALPPGLGLAGPGLYPMMSPSALAHYGLQSSHTAQVPLPHTLLSANGMTNIPKLFVPSVKVGNVSIVSTEHKKCMRKHYDIGGNMACLLTIVLGLTLDSLTL